MSVKKELIIIPTQITNIWLTISDYTCYGVPIVNIETMNESLKDYFEEIELKKGDLVFLEAYPNLNYLMFDGKCLTKIKYEDDVSLIPKWISISLQIIVFFIMYLVMLYLLLKN